jgi:hypothetical protein
MGIVILNTTEEDNKDNYYDEDDDYNDYEGENYNYYDE